MDIAPIAIVVTFDADATTIAIIATAIIVVVGIVSNAIVSILTP